MRNLKKFETHAEYEAAKSSLILPNVSICKDTPNEVHYNPWVETRVVAKFNVTDTSNPTKITSSISNFSEIEIDGVEQPSVVSAYTFSTIGEHTVKYTLKYPTSINIRAFEYCTSLTNITIPNSVTSIGSGAFNNCTGLTSVTIPDSVTTIGNSAFQLCSGLTSVTIPDSVTRIDTGAFAGCSGLTSIDIPDSVTTIGDSAFGSCTGLTSVTIPNSVTSIGTSAFLYCYSLTSITIPDSVTSIGSGAFYGCSGLTAITCNATTAPTIKSDTFQGIKTGGTLYVPQGSSGYDTWMQRLPNWTMQFE